MAELRDQPDADLADVLRALLTQASSELFGTVPPAIALAVSGDSLAFPAESESVSVSPAGERVVRSLIGSGEATISVSGTAARVRRARDLTLAILATDADRVVAGVRSTVHEGVYTTTRRLTGFTVTGVETLPAGDAATARITLRIEAVIELGRALREGEHVPAVGTTTPERTG